jgi:hypothetical protein
MFIIAPGQRALYDSLRRTFANDPTVEVVMDRRTGQRRERASGASAERRAADRRAADRRRNATVQKKLSARGFAVVGVVATEIRRGRRERDDG